MASQEPSSKQVANTDNQRPRFRALVVLVLLLSYLALLLFLTMAPPMRLRGETLNIIPFNSIIAGIRRGGWLFRVNVLGNILAFVPFGLLLPSWLSRFRSATNVVLAGAALSIAIELLQWWGGTRVADVDDVILNTLGALLGYAWYVLGSRSQQRF